MLMMRPQLLLAHAGHRQARGVERRAQVDGDDRVPAFGRKVLDRRHMLDAGVVDQDVDAAEFGSQARTMASISAGLLMSAPW
jgi:hypothetical protein